MHLRPVEADADCLAVSERQATDLTDDRPTLGTDRLDIEWSGEIEKQPHGIAATERRGRCGRRKRERVAQAVAVAPGTDGCRLICEPSAGLGLGLDFRRW